MSKFNVTMDRKEEIWCRYEAEIEADYLENAQKILQDKVENGNYEDDVQWDWVDGTNCPISQVENFAMGEYDVLIPDPQFFDMEGYEVIRFEDELNYEIEE